jgi:hydrogenase maturation protease
VGLTDLLDISRLTHTFPSHRALIGVEPALLDWAEYPSSKVAQTIAPVAEMALGLARRWQES